MGRFQSSLLAIGAMFSALLLSAGASSADIGSGLPVPATVAAAQDGQVGSSRAAVRAVHSSAERIRTTSGSVGLCPQGAAGCWADGVARQILLPNCSAGGVDNGNGLVTAYSGNWIGNEGTYPATGDIYWGHVVISFGVWPCPGAEPVVSAEAVLPPSSGFPFDPSLSNNAGRTRCFRTSYWNNVPNTPINFTGSSGPGYDCPAQPFIGGFGSTLGYSQMAASISSYMMLEFIFPIRTSRPLFGIASSNDRLQTRVSVNYDTLFAESWVIAGKSTLSLQARRSGSKVTATGKVGPQSRLRSILAGTREGTRLEIEFKGRRRGRTVSLGRKSVVPSATGAFSASLPRRSGTTRCQVEARWGGATSVTRAVAC